MALASTRKRSWIGLWIAAVGLLHSLGGFLIYAKGWQLIAQRGVLAGVHDFDLSGTAFWFLIAGVVLVITGLLIHWLDRNGYARPPWLRWAMLALLALLILPMPVTGAWLLVPPVAALFVKER